jgi:pimeloyl-ACP methyl ester carboxylesterase
MRQRKVFQTSTLVIILIGLATNLTRANPGMPPIADPVYSEAQQLIEIEPGRRLNLYCIGAGSPAVIFESGLADDTPVWGRVQPEVAKSMRACSYDRAGIGYSDPARRAGTSENIVDDLNRLLHRALIEPPYILVGHSYGGLNVVLYTERFPNEVAGMVLLDPALENQVQHVRRNFPTYDKTFLQPSLANERACVAAATRGFVAGTKPYVDCLPQPDPAFSDAINATRFAHALLPANQQAALSENESIMSGRSGEQLRGARCGFRDVPLIILVIPPSPHPLVPGETQRMQDAINAARRSELEALANRSSRGVLRFVSNSGHYIQYDQPSTVVDSIRKVFDQVR